MSLGKVRDVAGYEEVCAGPDVVQVSVGRVPDGAFEGGSGDGELENDGCGGEGEDSVEMDRSEGREGEERCGGEGDEESSGRSRDVGFGTFDVEAEPPDRVVPVGGFAEAVDEQGGDEDSSGRLEFVQIGAPRMSSRRERSRLLWRRSAAAS